MLVLKVQNRDMTSVDEADFEWLSLICSTVPSSQMSRQVWRAIAKKIYGDGKGFE